MRNAAIVLVIVAVIGGLFLASKKHAPKAPPPSTKDIWAKEGIPVETARIMRGDIEKAVEVTGNIDALDKAALSSRIAGRVARVYAREGDRVSKGMTIVMLDQQDALSNQQTAQSSLDSALSRLSQAKTNLKVTKIQSEAAIEQARSSLKSARAKLAIAKNPTRSQDRMIAQNNLDSAKANLDNAEANFKRNEQLVKQGAISESAFDVIKTQLTIAQTQYKSAKEQLSLIEEGGRSESVIAAQSDVDVAEEHLRTANANASQVMLREEDVMSAQAAVRQARAAVDLANQQFSYTNIKSPISGYLASRKADAGSVVSPSQPLADVVNLASVYFQGELSEREVANVGRGQEVRVQIDAIPNRTYRGVVSEIYPSGSQQSRSFPVRIKITGGDSLVKPGMFARGNIITGMNRNVLLVPKDAVEERQGTKIVFTVGPKNKVERHDITVLRENRRVVEIATPTDLAEGDVVVTSGRQNLQNGSLVSVR